MNGYRGGPYQQAMSGLSWMNNDWYDGKAYQTYSFAYTPGKSGNIVWYIGDEATWGLDARAIGPNGNIGQRTIPEEPMAMVINCGMSPSFAPIQVADLQALFPAKMRLDFVRIYQPPGAESMTCDPPGYETTDYIAKHPTAYQNINKTHWYVFGAMLSGFFEDILTIKQGGRRLCVAAEHPRERVLMRS